MKLPPSAFTCASPVSHPPSAHDTDPEKTFHREAGFLHNFGQICTFHTGGGGFPRKLLRSQFLSNLVVAEQKQDLLFHLDLLLSTLPFYSLNINFVQNLFPQHQSHHQTSKVGFRHVFVIVFSLSFSIIILYTYIP